MTTQIRLDEAQAVVYRMEEEFVRLAAHERSDQQHFRTKAATCRQVVAALESLRPSSASQEPSASIEATVEQMFSEGSRAEECVCCHGPHMFAAGVNVDPGAVSKYEHLNDIANWIHNFAREPGLNGKRVRVTIQEVATEAANRAPNWDLVRLLKDAAARLRARPQQEGA